MRNWGSKEIVHDIPSGTSASRATAAAAATATRTTRDARMVLARCATGSCRREGARELRRRGAAGDLSGIDEAETARAPRRARA